jgi:hypothetical protein
LLKQHKELEQEAEVDAADAVEMGAPDAKQARKELKDEEK